ncbi:MAG: 7TM-DISM domain-containing protein [Gallionella sp.]|nr:7TM-DISM domain-containing protein [Gallionella sp.]
MRRFFLLFIFLCGCAIPPVVWGEDFIVARAVLEDRAGTLSIAEVAQAEFAPGAAILARGYTDSAHWIRLRVHTSHPGKVIELRIRPTFLDEVQLYEADPASPGHWLSRSTGDTQSFNQRQRAAVTLGFEVKPMAEDSTYYLRLKTTSSSLLYVEALSLREAENKDLQLFFWQAIYLVFMLWLLFWAANDFAANRDPAVGVFLIFQAIYLVYAIALMGYLPVIFTQAAPGTLDKLTSFLVCGIVLVGLWFHRALLALFAPPRRVLRVLDVQIAVACLLVMLLVFGQARLALQLNSLNALLAAPTLLVLAWLARRPAPPGLFMLRMVHTLQSLSFLFSMLPLLGLVDATEWSLHATLIHGFISAMLIFILLQLRSRTIAKQAAQSALALERTRKQLEIEHEQVEIRTGMLAMLTHELKTPMSIIRMSIGSLDAEDPVKCRSETALEDMQQIVDRCQLADQLEQKQMVVRNVHCDPAELLAELIRTSGAPQRIHNELAGLPLVRTDPQLLHIVLHNLISNALKYGATDSPIKLRTSVLESGVEIIVSNAAGVAGLPDPDRVFTRYYRSPGAHRKTGSGQGLYLAHSITTLLGGSIRYDVIQNQVTFTLCIPR